MKSFLALGLILLSLAGAYLHGLWRLGHPAIHAMQSRQASQEKLRRDLNRKVDVLLKQKRGIPYEQWQERERFYYECLRNLLAEQGQPLPAIPDTSP